MKIFELTLFGYTFGPTYYGLMYALAFVYGYIALGKNKKYSDSDRENLFLYLFIGVILGGRLGYVLFYNFSDFLQNPFMLLQVWNGGMSFHGGLIGFSLAAYIFSKKFSRSFLHLIDDLALIVPVGLFLGRIGNYINKELLGFEYSGFLAVQTAAGSYFPSPLIEAFLEGIVLFLVLKYVSKRQKFTGQIAVLFLILYGAFRLFVELFIRTPDMHIGYHFGFLSQGAGLSIVMILCGIFLYKYLYVQKLSK